MRKSQVMVLPRGDGATAVLLAQLRLARQQWGTEGLALGPAAAYVEAATPKEMAGPDGAEVLDAMGTVADRIAERASLPTAPGNKPVDGMLAAQMDVAAAQAHFLARSGDGSERASAALADFSRVQAVELTEDDAAAYNDAAMRVNAGRWLARPAGAAAASSWGALSLITTPGTDGQTCVILKDARTGPLAQRCS